MNDIEVDAFLEHHGIKGQKWGIRTGASIRAPKGDFKSRSKTQKAILIGGGIAGWVASHKVTEKILGNRAPVTQLVLGGLSARTGARVTRKLLDKHTDTLVSKLAELPRKDRTNHGLNARATKLNSIADRRPTRGNIRKAQRATAVANRSANKTKVF